jgi:dihydrodipicolinate synthase/N-acetylneuraminate lyase
MIAMREALTGTIVPLVTPFAQAEQFDVDGMQRLIGYIIDQGADGIMATALTGEGPLLSSDEIREIWDAVFIGGGWPANGCRLSAARRM